MQRVNDGPIRPGWQQTIEQQGLLYWRTELPGDKVKSYWREGPHYTFTKAEIESMEKDALTLLDMLVAAGDYVVERPELMVRMGIPTFTHEQVIASWNRQDAGKDYGSVYGRYDMAYDGSRIKLLEFNADTPTCLVESVIQWFYHKGAGVGDDQWNGIYEALVDAWKRNMASIEVLLGHKPIVHFACSGEDQSGEDIMNLRCLQKACQDAGYETREMAIESVHLNEEDGRFYDAEGGLHLNVIFKLYPWEMIVSEPYGEAIFLDMARIGQRSPDGSSYTGGTVWIEPPYKMLWSNKAILPVLWKLFGDDPEKSQLLLPTYFADEKPDSLTSYVIKPIFGREGASTTIVIDGETVVQTDGDYGKEGFIVQAYTPLPNFPAPAEDGSPENNHPVLGIWMIDGYPYGLGIRESDGPITDNLSYFAPHVVVA